MSGPPDLSRLIGEDVPPDELERLRRADALLRSVPAPPAAVPVSLTQSVAELALRGRTSSSRRRLGAGLALAAALAALAFGIGRWTAGDGFETRRTVTLQPTSEAQEAAALIRVGARDDSTGNWQLELDVSGLPRLPAGEYYVLWLAKDGRYGATCGSFSVGEDETTVRMTVSYRLSDFDDWVISRFTPSGESPWLLHAPVRS